MQFNPQKTFFSSDAHFFHRKICAYSNRPFISTEEMNDEMIRLHNKSVSANDVWFHLGDFSFGKIEETKNVLAQLNGKKYFILGNHDGILAKYRDELIGEGLIQELVHYKEIYVGNQFICLFHYPCRSWNKSHYGSWHLHGHLHGNRAPFNKSVDVGYDAPYVLGHNVYRPKSFYEIKDFMDQQAPQDVDHHN